DLGMGMMFPFIAKTEEDKKTVYRAMGPFWDANEVWLVAAGGVTFAAFPFAYAAMFSSLYSPLMVILFALIMRAVSIEFRGLTESVRWKSFFDYLLAVSSVVPAFLFGLLFANIFRGIPIGKGGVFLGTMSSLFDPYGMAGGFLFVLLFLLHGALWLAIKSDGELRNRAVSAGKDTWPVVVVTALIFLVLSIFTTGLYTNYLLRPVLFLVPFIAVVSLLLLWFSLRRGAFWKAWFSSGIAILFITLFGVVGLHPNLIPSSIDAAYSLTIYNAASSPGTLKIMLVVVAIFVPMVIVYQAWMYWLFRDRITEEDLSHNTY
ncbi:MAG: cytochrome d ubiquinol oxidase subunit II, partial [Deltaproteobacteria bacterium]|nr:cytochrome d ubiquinol oxidase subunit II [Deltaproteobacteria bacterium]